MEKMIDDKIENVGEVFELTKVELPNVVGGYEITGTKVSTISFNFTKKPKLINRLFCKWCLGWVWQDW